VPIYPNTTPENVSIVDDSKSGKRIGSFLFLTRDDKDAALDYYEDKMTLPTWRVNHLSTEAWGHSDLLGRKLRAKPEKRGGQTRVRVEFEEDVQKSAKAPAVVAATVPDWLSAYPRATPQNVSTLADPKSGKRIGSFFFLTPDDKDAVRGFYQDNMSTATWRVSHAPTEVWGNSSAQGRKFSVTHANRGGQTRVRVTFEEALGKVGLATASPAAPTPAAAAPPAALAAAPPVAPPTPGTTTIPPWVPVYPTAPPQNVSVVDDPASGNRVGSFFFLTGDDKEAVLDFYQDKMTIATWQVDRVENEVWGHSDSLGQKFSVTPEARGGQTRVRVSFEEKGHR
jgi:hypothetical protein